jgi:hypothetical protein
LFSPLFIYGRFILFFCQPIGVISHNVPAVYDGLSGQKKSMSFWGHKQLRGFFGGVAANKNASIFSARQTVAEVLRGNGAKRNDLAKP